MLDAICIPTTCISCDRISSYHRKFRTRSLHRISATLTQTSGDSKVEYTPWLIVGLGNPGNKFHGTRHNVGFEMIDRISQDAGIALNTIQSKALIGIGCVGQIPVLLAKPQTYMNFSGESVGPIASYYQIPLRHILLVYDEMSLPNGVMRLQPKGGHGHHNGVKSVTDHLDGCKQNPRLCIGIGNPPGSMDMKAFLLQKFSAEEREQVRNVPLFLGSYGLCSLFSHTCTAAHYHINSVDISDKGVDGAIEQGAAAVRTLVFHGFDEKIDRFNLRQKYKYHKV